MIHLIIIFIHTCKFIKNIRQEAQLQAVKFQRIQAMKFYLIF